MFSKALLLLAVCFQALSTGNSAEWVKKIEDGFQIGKLVNVLIQPHDYSRPDCKIWFQETKTGDTGNRLLISLVGSASRFLINSYVNGKWQEEDNEYNIDIYQPITIDIMAEESNFLITYKDKQYIREYEFPSKNIKFMKVECPKEGEIEVQADWHEECSCKARVTK